MLRIHVECPDCNGVFQVKAFRAGHRVACKLCGSVVRVPDEGAASFENQEAPETRPVLTRRSYSEADDTSIEMSRRMSARLKIEISKSGWLWIGGGFLALLVLYFALRAGRSGAPPVPVPTPVTPVTPATPS